MTDRLRCSTPVPEHVGHGWVMMVPRPLHCGQIWLREKSPWLSWSAPVPPQRGQVSGRVPGADPDPEHVWHRASVVTLTDVVTPRTASSKDRWSSVSTSAPRSGPGLRPARRPRPKSPPNRSPKSPTSSTRKPPAAAEAAAAEARPAAGPERRTSSYSLRLSASPRTS